MRKSTRIGLKSPNDAPQIVGTDAESLNATSSDSWNSKSGFHCVSGYNSLKRGRISAHPVFVLNVDGKPLTPTTNAKARKLIKGKVAKPVWNKFSEFGIQMLVKVGDKTPQTILGIDNGTKFEGYAVVVGKENSASAMWLLPDKKKIVNKLNERRTMRRARRWRTCRRREEKFDNRERKGFIAPSQKVMVLSRLKATLEFFKCYPIQKVALEDVRFNHAKHRWGKNFSTIEVGKQFLYNEIRKRAELVLYEGTDTKSCREKYGYTKGSDKSAERFNSHCSDALSIAVDSGCREYVRPSKLIVVDDTYRAVRRQLHDAQFSKGGVRAKYSTGNFKGIRKSTICEFGLICGGTKNSHFIRNSENKRIAKTKVSWLSHHFKTKLVKQEMELAIPPISEVDGFPCEVSS